MCRAGEHIWSDPIHQTWMLSLVPPVALAAMTRIEWLKWRVRWRNILLLIAQTCKLLCFQNCCLCVVHFLIRSYFCREDDQWEQDCSESSRRHKCLPPVSPYRCRRHVVLDLLFDDVWRQLIGCMKELVQRHWECCTSRRLNLTGLHALGWTLINKSTFLCTTVLNLSLADDENISGNLSPVQQDFQNPFMLLSTLPTMLPKLGQSRVPPLTAGMQFQVSGLRSNGRHRGASKGVETVGLVSLSSLSGGSKLNFFPF